MSPAHVSLASEMTDALRLGFATLRRLMAAPDPKVSLRAVGELSKLLTVCVRLGVTLPEQEPAPEILPKPSAGIAAVPAAPRPTFSTGVSESRPDRVPPHPPVFGRTIASAASGSTPGSSPARAGPSAGVVT